MVIDHHGGRVDDVDIDEEILSLWDLYPLNPEFIH